MTNDVLLAATIAILLVGAGSWWWMAAVRRRDRAPKIQIDLGPAIIGPGPAITIDVRNGEANPIQVNGLAVDLNGPAVGVTRIHLAPGPPGATVPGVVAVNGRGQSWVLLNQLPMHTPGWSLRAEVLVTHLNQPLYSRRLVWDWNNATQSFGWAIRA